MFLSGLGGISSGLMGLFNNPADAAMQQSDKLQSTIAPYYDPWINAGRTALPTVMGQYSQLINDPASIYNMLGAGFESSPGYQYNYDQSMNGINQAAAAGGMLGSPSHQQQAGTQASALANQDYYNYMGGMQNLYGTGLSGMQGINQMGYNASDAMGSMLGQNIMNQAMLAAMMSKQQNSSMGGLLGGATSMVGGLF